MLWVDELGYPQDQLNVDGGSIAIRHPPGSTGARLLTQLVNELERREARYGLLTICEGGGIRHDRRSDRVMGLAAGTVSGHVASLSLNRPEVPNALNHGLTEQLAAALEGADRDPQVRAVAHR